MLMFLNFLVLAFEVLYYSIFMFFSRKEGKFSRYLFLFSFITIVGLFIGTTNIYSYLFLILMMLYGLKYIIRIKTSLYDMLIIFLMILFKVILNFLISFVYIFIDNIWLIMISYQIISFLLILLFKNKLNVFYNKLNKLWKNNNFYIRYIFSCLTYFYAILSILFLIFNYR